MVSEHASPLAALGGVDAGGQNVHVGALAAALGRRGIETVVHTRREDGAAPRRLALGPRVVVDHVDAGPAAVVSKDELLPYMDAFSAELRASWERDPTRCRGILSTRVDDGLDPPPAKGRGERAHVHVLTAGVDPAEGRERARVLGDHRHPHPVTSASRPSQSDRKRSSP